jgi:hypothetical protein
MNILKRDSLGLFAAIFIASFAGLTHQQQRILTGDAMSATCGAAIGAVGGANIHDMEKNGR